MSDKDEMPPDLIETDVGPEQFITKMEAVHHLSEAMEILLPVEYYCLDPESDIGNLEGPLKDLVDSATELRASAEKFSKAMKKFSENRDDPTVQ